MTEPTSTKEVIERVADWLSARDKNSDEAFSLGVVLLVCGDMWVAGFLQLDIFAQGRTVVEALTNLGEALEAQALLQSKMGQEPFQNVPTTPAVYWKLAHRKRPDDLGGSE